MAEMISVLILNYNASPEALKACVASVEASDHPDLEIVVVENGSTEHRDSARLVAEEFPRARLVDLGRNWGFSGGINRGLAECRGEWVFILNNDTEMDPACLSACAEVLRNQPPEVLGVVPKLLFLDNRVLFDAAAGNAVDPNGAAFNVGIGQLDVGQFDRVEPAFGPCFAAGLFRRNAFDEDKVGLLDETYFMYYEDVDWNWRANLWGYRFVTAPAGRVYHVHSAASRHLDYSFKYLHIERNLLATVLKNMEGKRAVKVWLKRTYSHLSNALRGKYPKASISIVLQAFLRLPDTWAKRKAVTARRVKSDIEIMRHAHWEVPYFDPANYAPLYTLGNLAAMYRRKAMVTGDLKWLQVGDVCHSLDTIRLRFEPGFISSRLLPLLEGEPDHIKDFVKQIEIAQG